MTIPCFDILDFESMCGVIPVHSWPRTSIITSDRGLCIAGTPSGRSAPEGRAQVCGRGPIFESLRCSYLMGFQYFPWAHQDQRRPPVERNTPFEHEAEQAIGCECRVGIFGQ